MTREMDEENVGQEHRAHKTRYGRRRLPRGAPDTIGAFWIILSSHGQCQEPGAGNGHAKMCVSRRPVPLTYGWDVMAGCFAIRPYFIITSFPTCVPRRESTRQM